VSDDVLSPGWPPRRVRRALLPLFCSVACATTLIGFAGCQQEGLCDYGCEAIRDARDGSATDGATDVDGHSPGQCPDGSVEWSRTDSEVRCAVCDDAGENRFRTEGGALGAGEGGTLPGTGPLSFALTSISYGELTLAGTAAPPDTPPFGVDLDGYTSTAEQGCHCRPQEGAKRSAVMRDGPGGIDNSFSLNFVPLIQGFVDAPSTVATEDARSGRRALVMTISAAGDGQVEGTFLWATDGVTSPVGSWIWHEPSSPSRRVAFQGGSFDGDRWVSGLPTDLRVLMVPIGSVEWELPIHRAVVTARLSPDGKRLTEGLIAGIVPAGDLAQEVRSVYASLYPNGAACDSVSDGIVSAVRQCADIPLDGEHDPRVFCDGVSVGIAFEAERVEVGPTSSTAVPIVTPASCP
jgi:hypothetical protein